jgi:hypothetical protein
MFADDNGIHVGWTGLSQYCTGAEAQAWLDTYGDGVPEEGKALCRKWVASKVAYDANRKDGDPLDVGVTEAFKAFVKA